METSNVLIDEKLHCFLRKFGNSQVKRELLAFWGKHSKARFSSYVICSILDCSKSEAEYALKVMVEEGLLDNHVTNNVTLYSLSMNEDKRRPILELSTLGWYQQNNMIKNMRSRNIQIN